MSKPALKRETASFGDVAMIAGQMLIAGFRGHEITDQSSIARSIRNFNLGGVILFDNDVETGFGLRNIADKQQLRRLTSDLQKCSQTPIIIGIDQEGGKVARLKPDRGFSESLSAEELGRLDDPLLTMQEGERTGKMLSELGINLNFAPVVDLNKNPDNPVISKWHRSYGKDADTVLRHSAAFIKGMKKSPVLNCIKHFPGHGSSTDDSHLSLPDITTTWSKEELRPYKYLIDNGLADTIMTGHLMNREIDESFPATLSEKFITGILRNQLSYTGVVISDDLGMKAIASRHNTEEAVFRAINAGVDLLLFANMLDYNEDIVAEVHQTIVSLVAKKAISSERIEQSYKRIRKLKRGLVLSAE